MRTLWASTTPLSSEGAWERFAAAVRAVVPQFGQAASVVALDNYRAARIQAGVTTTPRLPRIEPIPASKIDAGLSWARRAIEDINASQAVELAAIEDSIRGRVEAAIQKTVLDEARETTIAAVEGDERALGYRRVPRPDACAWCLALATRKSTRKGLAVDQVSSSGRAKSLRGRRVAAHGGAEHWGVYKSRAAAGQTPVGSDEVNRFHRNCHCVVEPIFSVDFVVPEWLQEVDDLYQSTDDFNHFRRVIEARRRGVDSPVDPTPVLPAPAVQEAQVAAIADLLSRLAA
ncbi:hypothetical protein [Nocardioides aromaticivorans]|nr:hypothetical protein [Nocardioides aromaticivorans]